MRQLEIREATSNDFSELMLFYHMMCEVLDGKEFLPNGNRGGFPSGEMVSEAISRHGQFLGIEDGKIIAAYILNHHCDPAYHCARWQVDAKPDAVMILHALRVSPQYGGRGYAKRLVEHAIATAKERNQKAIRLDVLEGNTIPERMYAAYGFQYVDTVEICYEDIGEYMRFRLMELAL